MMAKFLEICKNPVLWAKTFVNTVNNETKEIEPWTARWYQAEMLLDTSPKKVARCGRRTGKTETMCIDSLHKTNTIRSFRYIFAAPYEAQIRMIFNRISELINLSPYIKQEVVSNTKTPFEIKFKNGSSIYGASTGAGTSNGAVSLRGQRADAIALDESDYMNDADFDSILAIAGEREGISIFLSSTPTGARKRFWQCCTDKKMGYKEFHYPSTLNPNWSAKMEEEFRAQLSPSGYVHEILAEFGEQDTGVFNKEKLDKAMTFERYTYMPLTYSQEIAAKENNWNIDFMIPPSYMGRHEVYRPTPFRCAGIDWDCKIVPPDRNIWAITKLIAGNSLELHILINNSNIY